MSNARRTHVLVVGLRGFPEVQGGVEVHSERLYPGLAARGCDVEVVVRTPYVAADRAVPWQGVRFRRLWAPRIAGVETLVHSFLGVLYAGVVRPDILHLHAVGPALFAPLARLLGLRVVVTHHGPDYERGKFGRAARALLRAGEKAGARFANAMIVVSTPIAELVRGKHGRETVVIPNGVSAPVPTRASGDALARFGLSSGRYVLMVGRLDPDKRQMDLIEAFERAGLEGWKLAIVGGAEHPSAYTRQLAERASSNPAVVCTGFQGGETLRTLYENAGMFIFPSAREGHPIALLEALSYGLPVAATDIPANREVGIDAKRYFRVGDVAAMTALIGSLAKRAPLPEERALMRDRVLARYDWGRVAEQTLAVYRDVLGPETGSSSRQSTV